MATFLASVEEAHGLGAALAAQARSAGAAERRAQVAHQPGVDPDDAAAQPFGQAVGAVQVARPQRGGQAVVAALASASAWSSSSNGCRVTTGPKISSRLLAQSGPRPSITVGSTNQPGRSIAPPPHSTRPPSSRAWAMQPSTLSKCACDTSGPIRVPGAAGSPAGSARARSTRAFAELAVGAALHQQPRAAQADLPGVLERRTHQRIQVPAPIAVGEHQRRVLAAELQGQLLQQRRGQGRDASADFRAAGERNGLDLRMRHQRLADLRPQAVLDVEHAGRKTDLRRQLAQHGSRSAA
jgi:hypothetical protein